ncbi:DNA cytosine methyltransferase [Staphylococcus hominis]|uniref:DNA cytosine methyltransferase n=1 Tax=Staphylococcus hominis TaxID=1290 RepID=UPI0011A87DE8|nr:DNA cytosine methyltransferase [Staphylococcus hominis]
MNYISLFSSAGIGCYGLKQQGFDCIATSELIERRMNIQKANNKAVYEESYILGDITEKEKKEELYNVVRRYKSEKDINDIDVVIFTAPCQGMSVANHKKNDGTIEKNSLVIEALEIVDELNPKFFIAENVRSFMNTLCIDHNEKMKIEKAFERWISKKYKYEAKVINFKDYGANSSRTRTLVIGVRNDYYYNGILDELFPKSEKSNTLREVIGQLPSLNNMGEIDETDIFHSFKSYREDMRNWITDLKEGENAFDNKDPDKRPHRVKDGEIIFNVNKNGDKYKRQYWDKVAPCIHTRNDIISSQNTIHPSDDRVFSIRELMLMMNIPSDFKWIKNYTEKELNELPLLEKKKILKTNEINIRQSIGEAIPTIIVSKIAKNIKEVLNNEKYKSKTTKNYKQLQFTF